MIHDIDGNVLADTIFNYDASASAWAYKTLYVKTWTVDGNLETNEYRQWNTAAGAFVNVKRDLFTYDIHQNRNYIADLRWNETTSAWDTFSVVTITHTYDANDSVLTKRYSERIPPALTFVPYATYTWTRDAAGKPLQMDYDQESPFKPVSRQIWKYPAGSPEYYFLDYETWDVGAGVWQRHFAYAYITWHDFSKGQMQAYDHYISKPTGPHDSIHYQYTWLPDGSNILLGLKMHASSLDSFVRHSSYYNSKGHLKKNFFESYTTGWDTTGLDSTSYAYNPAGCTTTMISYDQRWFGPGVFGAAIKEEYEYPAVGTDDPGNPSFDCWPNPATGHVFIRWVGAPADFEILNMNGVQMCMYSGVQPHSSLDIENLAPGIYLLRSGTFTRKLVIPE